MNEKFISKLLPYNKIAGKLMIFLCFRTIICVIKRAACQNNSNQFELLQIDCFRNLGFSVPKSKLLQIVAIQNMMDDQEKDIPQTYESSDDFSS